MRLLLVMFSFHQKGIIHIFLLLLLLAGLTSTVYLVQHTKLLKTKASYSSPDYAKTNLLNTATEPFDEYNNQIVLAAQNDNEENIYQVEYQPEFDQFMLILYKTPIETTRKEAEQALFLQSGNNLDSLCALQFTILAPHFVAGGENYTDTTLDLCKKQTDSGYQYQPFNLEIENTEAINKEQSIQFLSMQRMVTSEQFPLFVYVKLCRNNGSALEGVWQVTKDSVLAEPLYNQIQEQCDTPIPNYLVFTQTVPVGAYVALCQTEDQPWKEWVWQVGDSGLTANLVHTQDGCTLPPDPLTTEQSANKICTTGQGFCSTNFLKRYLSDNAVNLIQASQVCNKESGGSTAIVAPDGGVGLFQIDPDTHGQSIKYWQSVPNNVSKAKELSEDGSDWQWWSAAYDYVCWNNRKVPACGIIKGKPRWQNDCL